MQNFGCVTINLELKLIDTKRSKWQENKEFVIFAIQKWKMKFIFFVRVSQIGKVPPATSTVRERILQKLLSIT